MQIEIGDTFLNTVVWIIIIGWGFARVIEVWLNVIDRITKKLSKRKEKEE